VGGLQLVYLVTAGFHLTSTLADHTIAANLAYVGFLVLATAVTGDYFENSPRFVAIETARALGIALMIGITHTWFGRPLDNAVATLVVLAAANLAVAWKQTVRKTSPT